MDPYGSVHCLGAAGKALSDGATEVAALRNYTTLAIASRHGGRRRRTPEAVELAAQPANNRRRLLGWLLHPTALSNSLQVSSRYPDTDFVRCLIESQVPRDAEKNTGA
mmetsp:Transcript_99842/g.277842  ORF Transcript_99842/g.277842 Transcript_99842/m.277842 type:complete len:108 (+) Transcript_99842:95-418(+)